MALTTAFGFILAALVLAVAWKALPGAHPAIIIFVLILCVILYVKNGGTITTQISNLASGKVK
jgi:hypothetical protein